MTKEEFKAKLAGYDWPQIKGLMNQIHHSHEASDEEQLLTKCNELHQFCGHLHISLLQNERFKVVNGNAILLEDGKAIAEIDFKSSCFWLEEEKPADTLTIEPIKAIEIFSRTGELDEKWLGVSEPSKSFLEDDQVRQTKTRRDERG